VLGRTEPSELLGKDMHALMHHARADGTTNPLQACPIYAVLRDSEGEHRDDEVFWHADGSCFPVEYWARPMRLGGQRVKPCWQECRGDSVRTAGRVRNGQDDESGM
jgi:hypothetical protein